MSSLKTIKRKNDMIKAFIEVSKKVGINNVTREKVGEVAMCCPSLINYHFGSMDNLIDMSAWQGVQDNDRVFMRQLWSIKHPAIEGVYP